MELRYVWLPTWAIVCGWLLCDSAAAQPASSSAANAAERAAGLELFEQAIRPALIEHCYQCHAAEADELQGDLRVDFRDGLLRGGQTGPALVPGKPDESLLLAALKHEDLQMPPERRLPDALIQQFARWIELGAPDPREAPSAEANARSDPAVSGIDWQAARQFWAFQRPVSARLPAVRTAAWPRSRIDYFVLAGIEQAGLTPNAPAAPAAWLRRLSLDLIGLPPTDELLRRVEQGSSELLEEEIVDQLMASPQFGERWARVWLDLARYAEDQAHIVGDDKRLFYPNAYLYRDWLIGALNRGIGYDDFVRLQIAADMCGAPEADLAALGFLGLGPKYYDRGRLEVQAEEWEDRVDTVCRSLLGLTVACARCHDHKYDPIPTTDYYALASVFASTQMFNQPLPGAEPAEKDGQAKDPGQGIHVVREGKVRDLTVFVRGNVQAPGAATHRGYLTVLSPGARLEFQQGSGRGELAETLASSDNPLTARVFVNRVWGQLIGHPIVETPSNFGALGQPPSHPELLDDLAARFMANEWSIKWLIREIVRSATYRQSSHISPRQQQLDPANRWLSRMDRKRLTVEAWRDSLLAAGGRLEYRLGGPSIQPDDLDSRRRTVYASVSRFELNAMLSLFDFPDANVHSARRVETTTPLQKLFALNNPFVVRQAEALVERSGALRAGNRDQAIDSMYRWLFARRPSLEERQLAGNFLARTGEPPRAAWVNYVQALLASNELLFSD
jgi:mono/diheme cytochrome c family protein